MYLVLTMAHKEVQLYVLSKYMKIFIEKKEKKYGELADFCSFSWNNKHEETFQNHLQGV